VYECQIETTMGQKLEQGLGMRFPEGDTQAGVQSVKLRQ
jgi:hypothetical protein